MNPPPPALLLFKGVSRAYGRLRALNRVSFQVEAGETIALFGANGAGKSTLLRVASTLLTPTGGTVVYRGTTLDGRSRAAYRQAMGMVGHASFLYDELSARENLILHGRLRRISAPHARADELLEQVGLAHRRDDRVSHFSRGMEQRLSLARALVSAPDLLLLDEPFSGLDGTGTEVLCTVLRAHHEAGGTTLLVSHDLPLGLSLADRYVLLDRGAVRTVADARPWHGVPSHEVSLDGLARSTP